MITINGTSIEADEFGWDGCHKFYLVTNEEGRQQLLDLGYVLFPIEELQTCWDNSCSLKFISSADLQHQYVGQFVQAEIT